METNSKLLMFCTGKILQRINVGMSIPINVSDSLEMVT